jgi:L-iditol 2-dehydrogenase
VFCHDGLYNLCVNLKEIGSSVNGGFAEFVNIPQNILKIGGLVEVPDNLSDNEAALLEPLACSLNGFSQMGPIVKKETTVAIIGDGPIGLLHLQISKKLFDAKTIVIGKIPHRIKKAKAMGADVATELSYNRRDCTYSDDGALKDTLDFTEGVGANMIIVATSDTSAVVLAQKIASKNSKINLFAGMAKGFRLSFDPNWLHYNQITITSSFSFVPSVLRQAAKVASEGVVNLSEVISHRFSLGNIKEAIVATERYYGLRVVIDNF